MIDDQKLNICDIYITYLYSKWAEDTEKTSVMLDWL